MDRMRAAFDEVLEKVKVAINGEPKSPVELLLDIHLPLHVEAAPFSPKSSASAVAIPTFVLTDFASRSSNIVDYQFILGRIWDIMIEAQNEPNQLKKALNLLHYLLINGSIQVLKDCQDPVRAEFLRELAAHYNRAEFEQYKFSKHLDVGAGVRKTAAEIYALVSNEHALLEARRSAEKLHQSLSGRGLRSTYPSSPHSDHISPSSVRSPNSSSRSYQDDASRPPRYSDSLPTSPKWGDDIGANIVTHKGTVLDDLYGVESNRHASRTDSASIADSSSSSRNSSRHASESLPTTSTAPSASVDLLGLEELLLDPAPQQQEQKQQDEDAKRRAPTDQRLVATI